MLNAQVRFVCVVSRGDVLCVLRWDKESTAQFQKEHMICSCSLVNL